MFHATAQVIALENVAHGDSHTYKRDDDVDDEQANEIRSGWSLVAFCALTAACAVQAATWSLTGALESHDPSIYKEGSTWWIMETSNTGIGVKYSANGHAWTQGGSIYSGGLSWWKLYNGNSATAWAPDIHDWNGKAILFYAVSTFGSQNSAIGLATATSIVKGDWVDHGAYLTSKAGDNYNAIDPNFVVDASGQPWLTFGSCALLVDTSPDRPQHLETLWQLVPSGGR